MLVQLGTRRDEGDVVDLLLECHVRIRGFAAMAVNLAAAAAPTDDEVRQSAAAVHRYFLQALPLHVADEEEDMRPLLAGRDVQVDEALAAMTREHGEHAPDLARLITLCDTLAQDPRAIDGVRDELAPLAARLHADFAVHLEREERILFPALRRLPDADRAALRQRLRDRRAPRPA